VVAVDHRSLPDDGFGGIIVADESDEFDGHG
jgi:hypothetical protein